MTHLQIFVLGEINAKLLCGTYGKGDPVSKSSKKESVGSPSPACGLIAKAQPKMCWGSIESAPCVKGFNCI